MDTTKIKLGVNYNPQTESVDFRLYSKNAVDISLEIFENPEDVEALAIPVLRHRIKINYTAINERLDVDAVISLLLKEIKK